MWSFCICAPGRVYRFSDVAAFHHALSTGIKCRSTRLILLDGYAGHIIELSATSLSRNYVVGMVVFLIWCDQFHRYYQRRGVSRKWRRGSLGCLAGQQMAMMRTERRTHQRDGSAKSRRSVGRSDFYGAMDGASKFVRGDAIAAVLIR